MNTRELVINKGKKDSVEVGMKFRILDKENKVFDPETKEELGMIQREKVRVKIVEVQEKISVGRTYETYEFKTSGSGMFSSASMLDLLNPPRIITKVKTLSFDENDTGTGYEPLNEERSYVKVGDDAELIIEDF